MPLPPALLARLAKRGIVSASDEKKPEEDEDGEEVIAEDYDDTSAAAATLESNVNYNKHCTKLVTKNPDMGVLGCPNKWIVFHECSEFCEERWGAGRNPDPKQEVKRLRMLDKFPLPSTWLEVYDPGTGRFYYWDTESKNVSWLPPGHPRAQVGLCAADRRAEIKKEEAMAEEGNVNDDKLVASDGEEYSDGDSAPGEGSDDDRRETSDHRGRRRSRSREREYRRDSSRDREEDRYRGRERTRDDRAGRSRFSDLRDKRRHAEEDRVDPMDPSSYSDVPRGSWSSGLERDVKTGVDSTASGPLFQQRPYPSPGDILRANAQKK